MNESTNDSQMLGICDYWKKLMESFPAIQPSLNVAILI